MFTEKSYQIAKGVQLVSFMYSCGVLQSPRPPLLRLSCACCQADCGVSIAVLSVMQRRTSASKTLRASETSDGGEGTCRHFILTNST